MQNETNENYIRELIAFWEEAKLSAAARLDRAITLKGHGATIVSPNCVDVLQDMINREDEAIRQYNKAILILQKSLLSVC